MLNKLSAILGVLLGVLVLFIFFLGGVFLLKEDLDSVSTPKSDVLVSEVDVSVSSGEVTNPTTAGFIIEQAPESTAQVEREQDVEEPTESDESDGLSGFLEIIKTIGFFLLLLVFLLELSKFADH